MRCYTITKQEIRHGIKPELYGGQLVIRLTTHTQQAEPIALEDYLPLEPIWSQGILELHKQANLQELLPIGATEIAEDGCALIPRPLRERTKEALVLVELDEGDSITTLHPVEKIEGEEVKVEYQAVDEAVKAVPPISALGIHVVYQGPDRALLALGKGAGFRVDRKDSRAQLFRWPRQRAA